MGYQQSVASMSMSKNLKQKGSFAFSEDQSDQKQISADQALEAFVKMQSEVIDGICKALDQVISYEYK